MERGEQDEEGESLRGEEEEEVGGDGGALKVGFYYCHQIP